MILYIHTVCTTQTYRPKKRGIQRPSPLSTIAKQTYITYKYTIEKVEYSTVCTWTYRHGTCMNSVSLFVHILFHEKLEQNVKLQL